ncbi:MAG: glycoside hydrolase family 95 protein [Clostridiales bacterium]|nr:glycoside hydrolase family 95 protein [Clostridiales bacterium]
MMDERQKDVIWYCIPAADWNEALPLGNGRLGAMVYGGAYDECISINEDTLWSGYPVTRTTQQSMKNTFMDASQLTKEGHFAQAQELLEKKMSGLWTQAYMPLCDLCMHSRVSSQYENYKRELDLGNAVHTVSYTKNNMDYYRETLVSFPDQVLVMHTRASKPKSINFHISLIPALNGTIVYHADRICIKGNAPVLAWQMGDPFDAEAVMQYPHDENQKGMAYAAELSIVMNGGRLTRQGCGLDIQDADEVTVFFAARTGFTSWNHQPIRDAEVCLKKCDADLEAAMTKGWESIQLDHIRDYQALYNRVSLTLGEDEKACIPLNERMLMHDAQEKDEGLYALYFQYGRYLTISASRQGTQASNLQGIWNPLPIPPWNSNYTMNINTEMNYWPTLPANLEECSEPLDRLIEELTEDGKKTASELYGAKGSCAHHNTDIWRKSSPVGSLQKGSAVYAQWPMGLAWLCRHLWEKYCYTDDLDYLRDSAFPLMAESVEFVESILTKAKNGEYILSPSTSPENTFFYQDGQTAGVDFYTSMSQEIAADLLRCASQAARILGMDEWADAREKIAKHLVMPEIGKHGELLEWSRNFEETDIHHRHVSHLYGAYPSDLFNLEETPELMKAVRISLERRGDESTGWAMGWRICLWARLGDGNRALKLLHRQLRTTDHMHGQQGGTYPNLLDAHPPFQIDGNYGACAGIIEMLMQSHGGVLRLLPALPDEWKDGEVRGLRARGGYTVDIAWQGGALSHAMVHADHEGTLQLSDGRKFHHKAGETIFLGP